MIKKIGLLLLVLLMAGSMAWAAILQVGPAIQYVPPINDASSSDFGKIGNYRFGGDIRLNVWLLQLDATALYNFKDDYHLITSTTTANVRFDFMFVDLGIGMGPQMNFGTKDWDDFIVNGKTSGSFSDVIGDSLWTYRLFADVSLGPLTLGAFYLIPSSASMNDFQFKNLRPEFDDGQLGITLLLNFF